MQEREMGNIIRMPIFRLMNQGVNPSKGVADVGVRKILGSLVFST